MVNLVSAEQQTLQTSSTLRQAVKLLNEARIKLVLVVDGTNNLVRTVTDGDVRRALISGAGLDTTLATLPFQEPIQFPENTDPLVLQNTLEKEGINAVVLTDPMGKPVKLVDRVLLKKNIFLSPPHIGTAETKYVARAFAENYVAPAGSNLLDFENALKSESQRNHALAVSSGTAGLHLAIRALDIPPGSRVYLSDKTFAASLQPLLYENLEPVLIDSEPNSWNMSPVALKRALLRDAKAGQLPRAILVVHLYGQSADMLSIVELADSFQIPIIEDAAESIGATCSNRPSGSHGAIAVYSFNGNKIITTSGGGAVVTDNPEYDARMRHLATQGREPAEHYQHKDLAYNYRMSNVLAGIGLGQIEQLADRVRRRRSIAKRYQDILGQIRGISFQNEVANTVGNRWLTVINLDPNHIDVHPYVLMRQLRCNGIECRPSWKPMHMQPISLHCQFEPHEVDFPVSAALFFRSLCLPSGSSLTDSEQDFVCEKISSILKSESN